MYISAMDKHPAAADTLEESDTLAAGTRVEIRGNPIGMTLDCPTGTVVEPDMWEGYYIVRLDVPAHYRHADGRSERLQTIREASDNLIVLPPLSLDESDV